MSTESTFSRVKPNETFARRQRLWSSSAAAITSTSDAATSAAIKLLRRRLRIDAVAPAVCPRSNRRPFPLVRHGWMQ